MTRTGKAAVSTVLCATLVAGFSIVGGCSASAGSQTSPTPSTDSSLTAAADRLVRTSGGPPGVVVVVQRGSKVKPYIAGVADVATRQPIAIDDRMRAASVAKAFSGAVALAVVADGHLSLDDTVGKRLTGLPSSWSPITLSELLQHTSGIPDFSKQKAFGQAVMASLFTPPPPRGLLSFVEGMNLEFPPSSRFQYSNSDNILVALMVEAATGQPYGQALEALVYNSLGLRRTTLPQNQFIPTPYVHGYQLAPPAPPEDVSEAFAAGWSWSSGGIVTTPADLTRFIRGYVAGRTTNPDTLRKQFTFVSGSSEPPGPGTNSVGLGLFRYQTRCGTVYGHTGNTPGYTQFVAASRDGTRSVTVSLSAQVTPTTNPDEFTTVRQLFELGVCAALR